MKLIRMKNAFRKAVKDYRLKNPERMIGFIPTMGYLHEGHNSLIRTCRSENDLVIVSIYVNPTQFAPNEDFSKYPRDEERDIYMCQKSGVDILYIPDPAEMYKADHSTMVVESALSKPLCGKFRPGHFDGVATIVIKLLCLATPDYIYLGSKDGQQAIIIKRIVRDLDLDTDIRILPTVREPDGLAMSSRNIYLTTENRSKASVIYRSLCAAQEKFTQGERRSDILVKTVRDMIETVPEFTIQYIECRDLDNLQENDTISRSNILAVAAIIDSVRLIDNIILEI